MTRRSRSSRAAFFLEEFFGIAEVVHAFFRAQDGHKLHKSRT